MNNSEYTRLLELKNSIDTGIATKKDKREYMQLLYKNGNISKYQYDNFLQDQNSEDIINAGLTIGGVMLATWLLSKLFDE